MKLKITKDWFEKRAAQEGDMEVSTGRRLTSSLNLTQEEIAALERIVFDALPSGVRLELTNLRAAVSLADELRKAQRAYMADRGNDALGKNVAAAAEAYDNHRAALAARKEEGGE